jgi:hypothetical protein
MICVFPDLVLVAREIAVVTYINQAGFPKSVQERSKNREEVFVLGVGLCMMD